MVLPLQPRTVSRESDTGVMAEAASGVVAFQRRAGLAGPCSLRMLLEFAMREREGDGSLMTPGVVKWARLAEWGALA